MFLTWQVPSKPHLIQCFSPSTGHILGTVRVDDESEVNKKVSLARNAQQSWASTSFAERRRVLQMLSRAVMDHAEDICKLSALDTGKTQMEAMVGEIMVTCEKAKWVCSHGEEALAPEARETGLMTVHKSARVEYHPLGVLGVIAPWNYPFHNMYNHIISGLFTGNAVVVKISEFTAFCGERYIRLAKEVLAAAGHSPDLVQLVNGFAETGAALVHSGVDKIIFTGSPQVGKHIMRGAADTLTPVVLELGGKDPMVICDDADLSQVVQIAIRGALQNCGQNCIGVERFYVYDSVHREFVDQVVEIVEQLRQGPPLREDDGSWVPGVDLGATTTAPQLKHIAELVEDAVAHGAVVETGGRILHEDSSGQRCGLFFEPTVLTGVTHDMRIVNEEVFGPVFTIIRVPNDDDDAMLEMVNSTPYGLGSSIFSRNVTRAERIAEGIYAGMANVNDFGLNYMVQSLPFGGVRISGFDRFSGKEGLRSCCLLKSVVTDRFPCLGIRTSIPKPMQYPGTENTMPFTEGLIGMQYAHSWSQRAAAVWQLIRSSM